MATMAVTQETPPLSATAARRAATAATVAANKAKAAPGGATNKPAAPVPGAATAKSKTQTATTIRLPPSTAAAPPKPATKSVTPTTPKPTTPKPTTTAPTTAKDAPSVAAAKTAARPSPAKKPTAPTAATSSSDTPTAAAAGAPKAHTAAASAASRRTPATASARTTTSIRLPPNPSGAAAKPPAVAGRPPVNMTQTTIRTPVKTPATAGVKKPLNSPANASLKSGSTVARAGSATPTSAAARNKTPTASSAPVTKKAPATTPSTPLELKKAIASVKAKFDETSMQLLAKEEELASLSFLDTASSDGGETLVPEIDLSKIASQDKDVVVAVITSKEKEVAKKKHQVRTLKARLERLRLEHERRVKDLNHKVAQRQSEKEAELESLHRDLADAIEKLDEVFVLRKKLDGSRSLHSSNIEELNRIHDDNLQSLELELQVAKQDRVERTGGTGHDAQDKYRQDLEELKRSHEKKLTKLLREHKEELEMIKKQHGEEQKQEIEEHEAELRERFESELIQIKASHASLVNDHAGAGSGMAEVLQERHARALEDLKVKSEKGHQHYLGGVQNKHQSDLLRLEGKHSARVSDLESKIKRLQEKLDTDKMTIRSKAEVRSEDMKNMLASEIAKRAEKHSEKMNTLEISSKEKRQQELVALQSKFSAFVADIQGTQDNAMMTFEGGYETRIAELIVEHEDRVRELENDANEQVERELERVEMEFEIDRERLAEEQSRKLADLKATHEAAVNELEDMLTLAEERAKEAVAGIKQTKQKHNEEMAEVKADLEAQLSAVEISIEALVTARERDEKSATKALEAGHATVISAGKATHEMNMSDALAKKEAAWTTKNKSLINKVETTRSQLKETQLKRDHIRGELEATERRLKEEHSSAVKVMHKDQNSRLEQREQAASARLAKVSKTQEEHANTHESKLADLLTSHHQQQQALKDQQEALLKARERAYQERIKALEMSFAALGVAPGSATTRQTVQKARQEVAKIKKQNENLKDENEQLQQVASQLREAMAL